MKNPILYLSFLLFITRSICSYGQLVSPDVFFASPQSQSFTKHVDFPINYSSGMPEINIPLYTIQSGQLSLPISIGYNSNGLKPNSDETGAVGLGWSLNAGGLISRTINKLPDEEHSSFQIANVNNIVSTNDDYCEYLQDASQGVLDAEIDIFSYSFPGHGGKFIFNRNENFVEFKKPIILPYEPIKIIPNDDFTSFSAIDENGITFVFSAAEYCYNSAGTGSLLDDGTTSWYLTQILSTDKSDTISFSYSYIKYSATSNRIPSFKHNFCHYFSDFRGGGSTSIYYEIGKNVISIVGYDYTQLRLDKIKFRNGYINFTYSGSYYPNYALNQINVYSNYSSSALRTIAFSHSTSYSRWHLLDALTINGDEKYNFTYNTNISVPAWKKSSSSNYVGDSTSYAVDYYGYYNGANSNTTLMQSIGVVSGIHAQPDMDANGYGIRTSNPDYAKAGTLKTITYPTKGTATFNYEGNAYMGASVGGLRIQSIVENSGDKSITRLFSYLNETMYLTSPAGSTMKELITSYSIPINYPELIYFKQTFSSNPTVDITVNGRPIVYEKVTETIIGSDGSNNGKIIHEYDLSVLDNEILDMQSFYDFSYYPFSAAQVSGGRGLFGYYRNCKFNNIHETSTVTLNAAGDTVQKQNMVYSNVVLNTVLSLKSKWFVYDPSTLHNLTRNYFFAYKNSLIPQYSQTLSASSIVDYFPTSGTSITNSTSYIYNSYNQVKQNTTKNSKSENLYTYFTYPSDYNTTEYSAMVAKNIISPVIQKQEYNGTTHLKTEKTNYSIWTTNVIMPVAFQEKNGSGSLETRMNYDSYDNSSNLLQSHKEGDIKISYIWGYNGKYPVAKIIGLDYSTSLSILSIADKLILSFPASDQNVRDIIKKIRDYYVNSNVMVYTYTYKPLIGLSSETDPTGKTTYYEYDNYGHLRYIKDQDLNIIQEYKNHYKE